MFIKLICLVGLLAGSTASSQIVVTPERTQAVIGVCRAAVKAAIGGDTSPLQRYLSKMTPEQQMLTETLCTAYVAGFSDGLDYPPKEV